MHIMPQSNTAATKREYLLNANTACCSPECTDHRGRFFNLNACCQVCPEICRLNRSQLNDSSEIKFVEPQLSFYRARVEDQAVMSFGGTFADVDLRPNNEYGGRRVDRNHTALHYPLDIFDRGGKVLFWLTKLNPL